MSSSVEDQKRPRELSEFQFQLLPSSHSQFHHHNPNLNPNPNPYPAFSLFSPLPQPHSPLPKLSFCPRYQIDSFKSQTSKMEIAPSMSKIVYLPSLQTEPGISRKHHGRSKISRNAKSGTHISNTESPSLTNTRYDSSLGFLTKKFVSLIQEAKDGTLDLNKTSEILEVQKRRIYDITNVLEGIGLMEKTSKNHIRWKGYDGLGPSETGDQVTKLKAEVEILHAEECQLDDSIRKMQELLRNLEEREDYQKYLCLTEEDILGLPCFQNQTLIVIKAPYASFIEVPDPDEDNDSWERQYRMIIRSTTGPIDLYLLSKRNTNYRMMGAGLCLESQDDRKNPFQSSSSLGSEACGIQKITPDFDIKDDYWFQSDPGVSLTDLWASG